MIPKDRVIPIKGHMDLAFHWNQINLRISKNNLIYLYFPREDLPLTCDLSL